MAKTEESPLSVILGALAQGVGKLPVEIEKQKTVRAQNAFQNFTMQQQMQQQQQQQQQSMLDMELKKLQMKETNERLRQLTMMGSLTPEQRLKMETDEKIRLEQAKSAADAEAEKQKYGNLAGLTGDARNIAMLFGVDAVKNYYNEQKFSPYVGMEQYRKYQGDVDSRNNAIIDKNHKIKATNAPIIAMRDLATKQGAKPEELAALGVPSDTTNHVPLLPYPDWRQQSIDSLGLQPLGMQSPVPQQQTTKKSQAWSDWGYASPEAARIALEDDFKAKRIDKKTYDYYLGMIQ